MTALARRLEFLFTSTKGLLLLSISTVALVAAVWGTLSGPMVEWGVKDFTVRTLGMTLDPAHREGRIVMLYHVIAMAVVAACVYLVTDVVTMRRRQQAAINGTITAGYLTAMVFGLWFAYFGRELVFHGLFLVGQSLVFFAGVQLAIALWPWRREYRVAHPVYAHTRGGVDLERVAFFTMTVAMLGSAIFGAVTGSYWGRGHDTFLAEDLVRVPHKTKLQLSIIGHLHIMLTLIGIAVTLVVGRWLDFRGVFHKLAMPLMIAGTIVITLGVWAVVPYQPYAHQIIHGGSVLAMTAALLLVIYGWRKLAGERNVAAGAVRSGAGAALRALLRDPLRFGALWQMVFMNFTVSGIGIFMAIRLNDIFRVWPAVEERISLTGHWHILAGLIASIILLVYADLAGLRGRARQVFGWTVVLGSDLAFGAVTVFSMKRLFVSEVAQQAVVDWTMLLTDLGLAAFLVALALLLLWRLFDLFVGEGTWRAELEAGHLGMCHTTAAVRDEAAAAREVA